MTGFIVFALAVIALAIAAIVGWIIWILWVLVPRQNDDRHEYEHVDPRFADIFDDIAKSELTKAEYPPSTRVRDIEPRGA